MNNHTLPYLTTGQNLINAQQLVAQSQQQQQAQDNRIFFDDFSPSSNMNNNGDDIHHLQFPYSSKGVPILQKELFRTKRSYVPVELDKRAQLIRAVEDEGLTIKEAAQNLKINYSTAKHIVKIYKRTGEIQTQIMSKRLPERDLRTLEVMTMNGLGMQSNQGQWINPSLFGTNHQIFGHSLPAQNTHQILTMNSAGQNFGSGLIGGGLNQQLANYGRAQGLQNNFGQFQNQPDQLQSKRLKPNGDLSNDHQFLFGQYNNSRANELTQTPGGQQLQIQTQDQNQVFQKQGNSMNSSQMNLGQNLGGALGLVGSTKGAGVNLGSQMSGISSFVSFPGALGMTLNPSQSTVPSSQPQFQMNFATPSIPMNTIHYDSFSSMNSHGFAQGNNNFLQQVPPPSRMQSGVQTQFVPKIAQNVLQNNPNSTSTDMLFANPQAVINQKLGAPQSVQSSQTNQNISKQEQSGFQNVNSASLIQGSHALTPTNQNGVAQASSPQNISAPQPGRPQSQLSSQSQSAQQVIAQNQQNQSESTQNLSVDISQGNFKNPLPKVQNSHQIQQQNAQNSLGLQSNISQASSILNSNSATYQGTNTASNGTGNSNTANSNINNSTIAQNSNNQLLQTLLIQSNKQSGQPDNKIGSSITGLSGNGLQNNNGANSSQNQMSVGSISGLNFTQTSTSAASQINTNNLQSLIDQQNKSQILMQANIAQQRQQAMVLPQNNVNRQFIQPSQYVTNQSQQQHNLQMLVGSGSISQGSQQQITAPSGYGFIGQSQNIPNQAAMIKSFQNSGIQQTSLTQQMTDSIIAAHQFAKNSSLQQHSASSGSASSGIQYLNEKNGQLNLAAESSSSSNVHIQQAQQQQNQNSNTLTASPVLSTGGK